MPSNGKQQQPAGKALPCKCTTPGRRVMKSRNRLIESSLVIDNTIYKGNAVLNANR